MALEDTQRTLRLVRFHAAECHIDSHKVGVLGFSAGGHLSAAISTHNEKRLYPVVDAADKKSCCPDFAVVTHPGHLSLSAAEWDAYQGARKFVIRKPDYETMADTQFGLHPIFQSPARRRLLHCAEEGWDPCGDAFVCAGRAWVWAAAHKVSDYRMASASGDVAGDHWNDFR